MSTKVSFRSCVKHKPVWCFPQERKTHLKLKLKLWKPENGGIFLVQRPLDSGAQSSNASAKIFSEKEIKNATKGYNETRVLGAGGQGIIDEEEILSDSVEVASKSSRVENCKQVVQINLPNVVEDCCRDRPNSYHTSRDVKLDNTLLDEMLSDFGAWSVSTASAWCMELVSGEKALCFNWPHAQNHRLSEVLTDPRVMNAKNHGVIYLVALLAMSCTGVNGDERQVAAELRVKTCT
ncbi:hypothetical protein DY000_02062301 [Brassica cretica]|uniref:Uncharacterized protein n=1 Tax=Brassica cretica TaxID=69181 RepID=A0ABQ7AYA8_BRACR|nr:hypothetical protein DY000_02062301 [Brassica cretica]